MSNFTLSKRKEKVLPNTVKSVAGSTFSVNADYRNILRIFRMLADPDIHEKHKANLLLKWFFTETVPADGLTLFQDFVTGGEETKSSGKQQFCFEFDAEEIYSSFFMIYDLDLLEIEFLHWYQFRALLSGLFLCDNPLSKKVDIRTMDISKCENKAAARKAKAAVQIPKKIGYSDLKAQEKILQALKNGESVTELLREGDKDAIS